MKPENKVLTKKLYLEFIVKMEKKIPPFFIGDKSIQKLQRQL